VAVPEIGQNLHELDWQFLPFRSFSIYSVEALTKRFTQTIIQSLADGLSCLSLGAPLWWLEPYASDSARALR
jgi:hypothetical protein